jgi:hypothetical protein
MRWSDQGKKTEMKEKGMNFLILRDSESNEFAGFLSMLVTVEEGEELLYWHVLKQLSVERVELTFNSVTSFISLPRNMVSV